MKQKKYYYIIKGELVMNKLLTLSAAACVLFSGAFAVQAQQTTNKKVTVVKAQSTADGSSQIAESPLEECVVSLPSPRDLVAVSSSKSEYLKGINGVEGKNEHTQVWSAEVSISFKVRQTFVLIITTNSIEAKDPVRDKQTREVIKTHTVTSDPGAGDIFAGRSNRKYYYSTEEAAISSAKKRAEAWIQQLQPTLCGK
jgi:hypothetical protein